MELIPKEEIQWWLMGLKDTIAREQETGVIDMGVITEYIDSIAQKVMDY